MAMKSLAKLRFRLVESPRNLVERDGRLRRRIFCQQGLERRRRLRRQGRRGERGCRCEQRRYVVRVLRQRFCYGCECETISIQSIFDSCNFAPCFLAGSLSAMAAESSSSSRPATISPARLQEPPREDPEPIKKWKEEQVTITIYINILISPHILC